MSTSELLNALYSLFTLLLLGGSAVLWACLWRIRQSGQPILVPRFRRSEVQVPPLAAGLMLVYVLGFLLIPLFLSFLNPDSFAANLQGLSREKLRSALIVTLQEGAITTPVLLGAVLLGARNSSQLARLGFRTDRIGQQVAEGGLGFLVAVLPVALLLIATLPIRSSEGEHPLLRLLKEVGIGQEMVLIFLTAGILAPLKEELLFRVILQNWLLQFLPTACAIGLCAVIFSVVHGFPDAIPLLPLALVLGVVYHYRRSYLTVVVIHFLFNLYNLVATLIPSSEGT